MKNYFYIFEIILLLIFPSLISSETILFAWQIHRHGARAPYNDIINNSDIYKEHWLEKEELTNVGKRMLYLLGVKARKRYIENNKLLSETYSPQEILIRSTDVNRTIESVESFIQGLYPAGTGPVLNSDIAKNNDISYPPNKLYKEKFAEIIANYSLNGNNNYALPYRMNILPIHLFYKPAHEFELYNTNICKGHLEIYKQQQARDEIKQFGENLTSEFPNVFQYLEGTTDKNILYDYWSLYKYSDTFIVDKVDQRDFNILKDRFYFDQNKFDLLKNYSKKYLFMDYSETNYPKAHPEIPIMALSYTMHSLVHWMKEAKEGYEQNKRYIKYVVYSAHDASIGALEYFMEDAFKAFNVKAEYASLAESRFLEFYLDNDNNYRVRYLKGNSDVPKLNITFDEFKNIINEITWSDEKVAEYCKFNEKEEKKEEPKEKEKEKEKKISILFITMIILNVIVVALIIILVVILCKKTKHID